MGTVGVWAVVHGPDCLADAVEAELTRTGAHRVLVVTSPRAQSAPPFSIVRDVLGSRLVATFAGVTPHLPIAVVHSGRAAYVDAGADAVLSFGGGATSDAGKALRLLAAQGPAYHGSLAEAPPHPVDDQVAHIAIPTTLSGAEFSAAVGVTDPDHQGKVIVGRAGLAPTLTVLDSAVLAATPLELWATGAAKSLGDALDKLAEPVLAPHLAPLVLHAAATLARALEPEHLSHPASRLDAALASWATVFAGVQSNGGGGGAAIAIRHLLGPALGLPHAAVTAALLPHLYRFSSRSVPSSRHQQLAHAFGLQTHRPAEDVAAWLTGLIQQAPVPSRLGPLGIDSGQLEAIGPAVAAQVRAASALHRDVTNDAVTRLLLAAL